MLLRVQSIRAETDTVKVFELVDPDGLELSPFTAGSHVELALPDGTLRQYSLCNDPRERHRYLLGVLLEAAGRGGSRYMHELVGQGDLLQVSAPRNHFSLDETARRHVLIAGGIGVTPLLSMVARLQQIEAEFELHYCTRELATTAFEKQLSGQRLNHKVRLYHDGGIPANGLDLVALLATVEPNTRVYCCGPSGLMAAVKAAASHWPGSHVRFEHFAPGVDGLAGQVISANGAFEVELAGSGTIHNVPSDRSILSVLLSEGVMVDSSCEAGVCGTCQTRYLSGTPDHRDFVLTNDEQRDFLMICVSRAKTPRLVLDL